MGTIRTRYMSGEDERQYMIGEDGERLPERRGFTITTFMR